MGLFDFWKTQGAKASPDGTGPASPDAHEVWDDAARAALRDELGLVLRGEVRLQRWADEDILAMCREGYVEDLVPEPEWPAWGGWCAEMLAEARAQHTREQADWPEVTDCDRLDRAEEALRARGILLWQASPCCDTCSHGELPARIEAVDALHPGFRESARGYSFFIEQTLPEMLGEDERVQLFLAYGSLEPEGMFERRSAADARMRAVAAEVRACLLDQGLAVEWDGDLGKKLALSVCWRRRTQLT